jgi:capsule polysaccharide modification protein KpsS
MEPAMFPRRIVFTLDTLYADIATYQQTIGGVALDDEVSRLVSQYLDKKTVVIPDKDKHFFKDMGIRRLLSPDNFRRLGRKLYHKYVLRREEEYSAIAWYIQYHVIKMFRRKALSSLYSEPAPGERYVYFPFHVPLDVQLTVRCREYLDQERLVEQLAGSVPKGFMLYVKEHPAAVGGHSVARLKQLLLLRNVRLLHPRLNSYDIIRNSACVVTINSKVGFEAIMQQKPVVVLGKSFYKNKGVTVDVNDLSKLSDAINTAVNMKVDSHKRVSLLNSAFGWSYPGELYVNTSENLDKFFSSLKLYLIRSSIMDNR